MNKPAAARKSARNDRRANMNKPAAARKSARNDRRANMNKPAAARKSAIVLGVRNAAQVGTC